MNRRYTAIVLALFAIAALEFGLLGAAAAGIAGGGGSQLPPVGQRLGVPLTDTPTATATPLAFATVTPLPQLSPPSADLTGAFLQADPLTLKCDGSQESTVTVRLIQSNGDPAPDGTAVYGNAYNGSVDDYVAYTQNGYGTFRVRFYSDIFPYGPNFIIDSGLLEAGIRIRCNPNSNVSDCVSFSPPACATPTPPPNCFGSPPQASPPCRPTPYPCNPSPNSGPLSPPCPQEPTPTPYPCNPSPNSGPLSPPCGTPEPCGISPPSVSPPCEPTPTPYPCNPSPANDSVSPPCNPTTPFEVAVDCDVNQLGVQSYCVIPPNQNYDAAIVLINKSGGDAILAAFNFELFNPDLTVLKPLPSAIDPRGIDGNPDFNQESLAGLGWQCLPVLPDRLPDAPGSDSLLACVNPLDAQAVSNGSTITLASVHYTAEAAGAVNLTVGDVNLYDSFINELGSCPLLLVELTCTSAFVEIGAAASTPTTPASTPAVGTATRAARTSTPPATTATRPPRTATVVPRTPTVAPQPTRRPSHRCADVNGDGSVSIRDVKLIAAAVLRRDNSEQFDVNRDGRVSQRDVVRAINQRGRRC